MAPEVIVMFSTGGRASKEWEARAAPVRLRPEIGREIATPTEARQILSLDPVYKDRLLYGGSR
mgnify:FL=1